MRPPTPLLLRALRIATRFPATSCSHIVNQPPGFGASPFPRHASTATSAKPKAPSPASPASAGTSTSTPSAPRSTDRGPTSSETTQTDFGALNVLGNLAPPSTAIEACMEDGFQLDNGIEVRGGSGVLLVQGEAFKWRPWEAGTDLDTEEKEAGARRTGTGLPATGIMLNRKGQWEVDESAWGLLEVVWPKPELLILGLGASMHPLSSKTKQRINSLGIRLDIQDTRNAAAQFNLLATERGVGIVAAALLPVSWRG